MAKKRSVDKSVDKSTQIDTSNQQDRTPIIPQDDSKMKRNLALSIITLIGKMRRLFSRVGSSIKTVLARLIATLKCIVRFVTNPFIEGKNRFRLCRKKYIKAKALGKDETFKAIKENIKCMTSHVFTSVVHYCIPVISAGFLIASVRYTASLEYGIDNTYSSEELTASTQELTDELDTSLNSFEQNKEVTVFPKFSFKSIEDNEETLGGIIDNVKEEEESTRSVEDKMSEGYGVFIEDEFLGAVLDKSKIEETLNAKLNEYLQLDNVTEAHFTEQITYTQGLYLTEYMVSPESIIETMLGNAKEDIYYTIECGDNFTVISEVTELSIDELLELNPQITNPDICKAGDTLLIQQAEPFLHVEYTKSLVTTTEIPYDSITQDDDSLPLGKEEVITEGESGIQTDITEITYLNDEEISVTNLESELTKEPITEVIAVGTGLNCTQGDDTIINSYNVYDESVPLEAGQYIWPVDGGYISDPFISDRDHKGLDIAAPSGTYIYAGASGTVVAAGWNAGGYGYFVMIDHGDGYATLYAHMSKVIAVQGQQVNTSEVIGLVGSTGNSSGNHLHFEVRYNNVCQNPEDYIINVP